MTPGWSHRGLGPVLLLKHVDGCQDLLQAIPEPVQDKDPLADGQFTR